MDWTFISCGFDEKSETFCSLWRYSLWSSLFGGTQLQRTEMKIIGLKSYYSFGVLQVFDAPKIEKEIGRIQ